jgi:hypothetical protein
MYDNLRDKIYSWVVDYLPQEQATELTGALYEIARKYGNAMLVSGMILGITMMSLLLMWLA